MLNVTRLLDALDRPATRPPGPARDRAAAPPEVVVWNVTRQCNLHCAHCYASAEPRPDPRELTTDEGYALIDDLGRLGVAALVLSGGEPLLRPDVGLLARRAVAAGLAVAVSTNGTLIDPATAHYLRDAGVGYMGVSIDGLAPLHDRIRGLRGAFDFALRGLWNARDAGLRVGLRFTLCRPTLGHLGRVLDLMEREGVDRGYVSHLVHVGRARRLSPAALGRGETRRAVEMIFDRAEAWRRAGARTELVTGNSDADGVALYLRLRCRQPEQAGRLWHLLSARGGNASGVAIAGVGVRGDVHPDQFWTAATLGNVRERPLSAIWTDPAPPLLAALRDRGRHLTGRCRHCPYLALCGGGNRARAEALTGDRWAADPACPFTDAELGLDPERTLDEPLEALAGPGSGDGAAGECAATRLDGR